MNFAVQSILVDTCNLALLLLAIGLPAYALLRRYLPTASWERGGNVWTAPFNAFDLFVVVLFAVAARTLAMAHDGAPPAGGYSAGMIYKGTFMFVLVAAMIVMLFNVRRVGITELFGFNRLSLRAMLTWAIGGALAAILTVQAAAWLWQEFILSPAWDTAGEQPLVRLLRESPDMSLRLAIALSACLIQPITEEVIFRGYFYPAVKRHTDGGFAAIASSVVFAVLHMHVPTLGPLFVMGLLLVLAYELSGSLWIPIAIHAIFNTTTVVFEILQR